MITIEFGPSSSTAHTRAVMLASQAPHHTMEGSWYRAEYPSTHSGIVAALELWAIIRTWKAARLLVNGAAILPQERYPMLEVLHCAARATEFDPPSRYCRSYTDHDESRPPVPCRHWMTRWAYLLDRVRWDEPTRVDDLRALLSEFSVSRCPFLDTRSLGSDLAEWRPLNGEPPARELSVERLLNEILENQRLKRRDGAA